MLESNLKREKEERHILYWQKTHKSKATQDANTRCHIQYRFRRYWMFVFAAAVAIPAV